MKAEDFFERMAKSDPIFARERRLGIATLELARNVYEIRRLRGLTAYQLATNVAWNCQRIEVIETGGVSPRVRSIAVLAEALDVEPWQLLKPGFWRELTDGD